MRLQWRHFKIFCRYSNMVYEICVFLISSTPIKSSRKWRWGQICIFYSMNMTFSWFSYSWFFLWFSIDLFNRLAWLNWIWRSFDLLLYSWMDGYCARDSYRCISLTICHDTWMCFKQVGKVYFELVDYVEADRAFGLARQITPYNLEGMDVYSTVLYVSLYYLLSASVIYLIFDIV